MRHNLLAGLNDSLESVDFQSPAFFNELTAHVAALQDTDLAKADQLRYQRATQATIKKHTNMSIDINFFAANESYDAFSVIAPVHHDSALGTHLDLMTKNMSSEKALKELKRKHFAGLVNQHTGRVDGFFAKIQGLIYISTDFFESKTFPPEQVSAILLHEIGHLFTSLVLAAQYVHGMAVMQQVSRAYVEQSTTAERGVILTKATEAVGDKKVSKKDVENALEADKLDPDSLPGSTMLIFRTTQDQFDDYAGKALEYSGRVFEQLSDQYAARYGAGEALVQAFNNPAIQQFQSKRIFNNFAGVKARGASMARFFLNLFFGVTATAATAVFSPVAAGVVATIYGAGLLLNLGMAVIEAYSGQANYDGMRTRIEKIMQQTVVQAKDPALDRDTAKKLIDEHKEMKKIADQYVDKTSWMAAAITLMVPPWRRRNRFSTAMAQLEKLASSELYIQSQKFRTA